MSSLSNHRRIPRWSLRSFLTVIVLVGIGLAYWWQRPRHVVTVTTSPLQHNPPPAHLERWPPGLDNPFRIGTDDPFGSSRSAYYRRDEYTLRRIGLGNLLRHGPARSFNRDGQQVFLETWRAGRLHGPYRMWSRSGQLLVQGRFDNGRRHGEWQFWSPAGRLLRREFYQRGTPAGTWIEYTTDSPVEKPRRASRYVNGQLREVTYYRYVANQTLKTALGFDGDRITTLDGKPLTVFTDRVRREAPDWAKSILTLGNAGGSLTFHDLTLPQVLDVLERECGGDRFRIERSVILSDNPDRHRTYSDDLRGWPLGVSLAILLSRCRLALDYRYGQFVITSRSDAENWRDRSGVWELVLPPGSRWERFLEQKTGVEPVSLGEFAQWARAGGCQMVVDEHLLAPFVEEPDVNYIHSSRIPRRFWLWQLVGRHRARCYFVEDVLFVRPLGPPHDSRE